MSDPAATSSELAAPRARRPSSPKRLRLRASGNVGCRLTGPPTRAHSSQRVGAASQCSQAVEKASSPQLPEPWRVARCHRIALSLLEIARQSAPAALGRHRRLRSARRHRCSLPRVVSARSQEEPRVAALSQPPIFALSTASSPAPTLHCLHPTHCRRTSRSRSTNCGVIAALSCKFALLEHAPRRGSTTASRTANASGARSSPPRIKSLRTITNTDWVCLIEPLIVFDAILRQDPAGAYAQMDFESRELYRKRIAFVARHSDCTEIAGGQAALELAREGRAAHVNDPRMHQPPQPRRLLPHRQGLPPARAPRRLSSAACSIASAQFIRDQRRRFLHRRHSARHHFLHRRRRFSRSLPHYSGLRRPGHRVPAPAAARHAGRGGPGQQHHHRALRSRSRCPSSTSARAFPPTAPRWSRFPRCC